MKLTRTQIKRRRESIRRFYASLPVMTEAEAYEEHYTSKIFMGDYDYLPKVERDKEKEFGYVS